MIRHSKKFNSLWLSLFLYFALLNGGNTMLRCVGSYDKFCRALSVPRNASETDVRHAFRVKFPEIISSLENVLIQVYDDQLGSYLDWEEETVLSVGSKIKALPLEGNSGEAPPPCRPLNDTNRVDSSNLSPTFSAPAQLGELDPAKYVLPQLPADIAIRLSALDKEKLVPANLRSRIIEWLCHDLFRYTLYPQRLYEEVSRQIVLRYEILQDKVGTGYDSWHRALRFKCKYERSKIENMSVVQEKRKKFGQKCVQREGADDNNISAKRVCRMPQIMEAVEDELSINTHTEAMKKEMVKQIPDVLKVRDSMARTFAARRKWVTKECPSAEVVFEAYPALAQVEEIFLEFKRITGVHPEQLHALAEKHVSTLVTLADKKLEVISVELLAKAKTAPDGGWFTTLAFLLTLPRMLKERTVFLKDSAPWFSAYPVVVWKKDMEDLGQCITQVENQVLKTEHPAQAILAAFCLHWVFNFMYQPGSKGFYTTLECLLNIASNKPTGMVVKLVSALRKAA